MMEVESHIQIRINDAIVTRLAQQDKVPWYHKPNLRRLYLLMTATCLGVEMTNGFDGSMINGLLAVPSWLEYFDHPRSAILGFMVSAYAFGCFVGLPFVPAVVDGLGRRRPILFAGTILIVAATLQGSALNITMFIVARFMLGFSDAFCLVAASSLIGELSHPKERAVMSSFFSVTYYFGAVAAAAVTLKTFAMSGNLGWRIPSYLQMVPSLVQGRRNEAYYILTMYHAEGDENSEFVKAEYTQIEETLEAELKIAQLSQKDVFSTPGMRKRFIVASFFGLFAQWCGIGLISHLLPSVLDTIGIHDNYTKQLLNLARVSWGFVFGICAALIVPQYPRRRMFLVCTISLFVVFTAWTVAIAEYSYSHNEVYTPVVLVLMLLYNSAFSMGYNALPFTYLVELFPFHVRARGISLHQWWVHGAAFAGELMNPIGIDVLGWRWYIFYCVGNAFQVVFVYFMFPETYGRTLEELTFLFEDEQEALRQGGFETLREHREPETYGTTDTARTDHGEQR